jgi:hypothetical protein
MFFIFASRSNYLLSSWLHTTPVFLNTKISFLSAASPVATTQIRLSIGWLESQATPIKIFIDVSNQVQFDRINKHALSLWPHTGPRRSRHVVTCSRPSVRRLSSSSQIARTSFSQVQRFFTAEHCLASRSYLICQNVFRDTFPCSPVPNRPTMSRPVNSVRDTGCVHRVASVVGKEVNACIAERGSHFQHLIWHCFLFPDFNVVCFLTNMNMFQEWDSWHFDHTVYYSIVIVKCKTCLLAHGLFSE